MNENLVWHNAGITRQNRERLNEHKAVVVWFTGLSGAGKSTLAHALEGELYKMKCRTYVFDGDNVRHGLCGDLGFSDADRTENIRRVGEIAKLTVDAGLITMAAFISPIKKDRDCVRGLLEPEDFIEVYCRCSLSVCEKRDVKGFYRRARSGEISNFTGISSPYDEPENPDLVINTDKISIELSVSRIISLMKERGVFSVSV